MNNRRALWTNALPNRSRPEKKAFVVQGSNFCGKVLGIDPSLRGSGFAVLEADARTVRYITSLTLKLTARRSFTECLGEIFSTTRRLLEEHDIRAVAVEQTVYVQNFRTAHILGSARGACLAAVALQGLPVSEFAPLRIKKAVTGLGQATKIQVSRMAAQLLRLLKVLPPDESDAAAAALCYIFSLKSLK